MKKVILIGMLLFGSFTFAQAIQFSVNGISFMMNGNNIQPIISVDSANSPMITYDWNDRISWIGGTQISYDWEGKISWIGGRRVFYDFNDRISGIGGMRIYYDWQGRISNIIGKP